MKPCRYENRTNHFRLANNSRVSRETVVFNENDQPHRSGIKLVSISAEFVAKMQEEAAHRLSLSLPLSLTFFVPSSSFLSLFPFLLTPYPSFTSVFLPLPISFPSLSLSLSLPSAHKTRVHFYAAFTVLSRGSFSTQEEASPRRPIPERVLLDCRKRKTLSFSREAELANDGHRFEKNAGADRRGRGRRDTEHRLLNQLQENSIPRSRSSRCGRSAIIRPLGSFECSSEQEDSLTSSVPSSRKTW